MSQKVLNLINEVTEKKILLHKLANSKTDGLIDEYSITEMHCIDAISKLEHPNVTKLAVSLNMTKGAITKIIKKLLLKSAVSSYEKPTNKKEKYYKLTPVGEEINKKHRKIHDTLCLSELEFLSGCKPDKLVVVEEFLKNFNKYLTEKIRSMK